MGVVFGTIYWLWRSASGGDIKTITRYYADPAQPNLGDIRVSELL